MRKCNICGSKQDRGYSKLIRNDYKTVNFCKKKCKTAYLRGKTNYHQYKKYHSVSIINQLNLNRVQNLRRKSKIVKNTLNFEKFVLFHTKMTIFNRLSTDLNQSTFYHNT